MILTSISIGVSIVLATILVAGTFKKYKYTYNFAKNFETCGLIVMPFYNNGNQYNFIIDTGASQSHISSTVAPLIRGARRKECYNIFGIGNETIEEAIITTLRYKDKVMNVKVYPAKALDNSFVHVKMPVHGILGSDFIIKNKIVIDSTKQTLIFK
jgi:hypothetical protein